jgi:hypothetical protein
MTNLLKNIDEKEIINSSDYRIIIVNMYTYSSTKYSEYVISNNTFPKIDINDIELFDNLIKDIITNYYNPSHFS